MQSKIKNGLLALFVLLIFQEFAFRLAYPLPELSNFDRANYMPAGSKVKSFAFYHNTNWYWESALDTNYRFVHKLNQYGFRDKEWKVEKEEGKTRVLMLGDSFLEGIMAEQSQTISEGFKKVDKAEKFETMNMGIMGCGINSYLKAIVDVAPVFNPDVICILLYSNDISSKAPEIPSKRILPEYYNKFKPRVLELIDQSKKSSSIPSRFHFKERPFLPSFKNINFPWRNRMELLSKNTTKEVENSMIEGGTNPFKLNQILREQEGLSQDANLNEVFFFLSKYKLAYQTKFVVCYIPARHQVTNYYYQYDKVFCTSQCPESLDMTIPFYNRHQSYLQGLCTKYKLEYIDFTERIKAKEQAEQHLYWKYDDHMRREGYQLIGKELFKELSGN